MRKKKCWRWQLFFFLFSFRGKFWMFLLGKKKKKKKNWECLSTPPPPILNEREVIVFEWKKNNSICHILSSFYLPHYLLLIYFFFFLSLFFILIYLSFHNHLSLILNTPLVSFYSPPPLFFITSCLVAEAVAILSPVPQ